MIGRAGLERLRRRRAERRVAAKLVSDAILEIRTYAASPDLYRGPGTAAEHIHDIADVVHNLPGGILGGGERRRCRCRKCRPGRSGGVSVFMEDAAESITSSDVESSEWVRFGDRLGERAQGCRSAERAMGPVFVVKGFVLAKRVEKMGLVHDQGSVE